MKKIFIYCIQIVIVSSCSVFKAKEKVGCPVNVASIGAEKLLTYQDPNYKPKTAKEKAELKAFKKQLKKDAKSDKNGSIY